MESQSVDIFKGCTLSQATCCSWPCSSRHWNSWLSQDVYNFLFLGIKWSSCFLLHLSLILVVPKETVRRYLMICHYSTTFWWITLEGIQNNHWIFFFLVHFLLCNKLYLIIFKSVRSLIFLQQCIFNNTLNDFILIQINRFLLVLMCLLSTSLNFYLLSSLIGKCFLSIKNHRHTVHLWQIIDLLDYSDILNKGPVYWDFLELL